MSNDLGRTVGRGVVHYDDLVLGIVDRDRGSECVLDIPFLVVGRDENSDRGIDIELVEIPTLFPLPPEEVGQ